MCPVNGLLSLVGDLVHRYTSRDWVSPERHVEARRRVASLLTVGVVSIRCRTERQVGRSSESKKGQSS